MTKMKGKVGWSDLEGGYFTFEAKDGSVFKLEGTTEGLKAGQLVELEGKGETVMGVGFGTPVFHVKKHRVL